MRAVIAALAVILAAGSAFAETVRKVPQDYKTIQGAVDDADEGDTILVSKREDGKPWDEHVSTGKSLKFIGKRVTWDGHDAEGSAGTCLSINNEGPAVDVVIQGFNFRNGSSHVYVYGNNTLIQSCTFRGAYNTAVALGGEGVLVQKCTFRSNSQAVVIEGNGAVVQKNTAVAHGSGAIYVYGSGAHVLGNKVARNGNSNGISASGPEATVSGNTVSDASTGISVSGDDCLVEKNRISRCTGGDSGIDVYGRGADILSNQVTGSLGLGIYLYQGSSESSNPSLVEGNVVRWTASDGINCYGFTTVIRGNTVSHSRYNGIGNFYYANENGCVTEDNTVSDCFRYGIQAAGGGHVIAGNQVRNVYDEGIRCSASEYSPATSITGNRVQGFYNNGIFLDASYSDFEVDGNEVSDGQGHATGIYLSAGYSLAGTVDGNRVGGATGHGIFVSAGFGTAGTSIQDNVVTDSGTNFDYGIYFSGSSAVVSGNSVSGQVGQGIGVYGDGHTVHANAVTGANRAGLIVSGNSIQVTDNTGKTGDGEGFINYGGNTTFTGNTFLGFRLDVANTGSFASEDITVDNTFVTGGAGFFPQVFGL